MPENLPGSKDHLGSDVLGTGSYHERRIVDFPKFGAVASTAFVVAVTFYPSTRFPHFAAMVSDADLCGVSSQVKLIWFGRKSIRAIVPTVRLRFQGVLTQRHGFPTIYNPWYEIKNVPSVEHREGKRLWTDMR